MSSHWSSMSCCGAVGTSALPAVPLNRGKWLGGIPVCKATSLAVVSRMSLRIDFLVGLPCASMASLRRFSPAFWRQSISVNFSLRCLASCRFARYLANLLSSVTASQSSRHASLRSLSFDASSNRLNPLMFAQISPKSRPSWWGLSGPPSDMTSSAQGRVFQTRSDSYSNKPDQVSAWLSPYQGRKHGCHCLA